MIRALLYTMELHRADHAAPFLSLFYGKIAFALGMGAMTFGGFDLISFVSVVVSLASIALCLFTLWKGGSRGCLTEFTSRLIRRTA